jgi:hypothetical protein
MSAHAVDASACVYVVRLHPLDRDQAGRLSGRLEHVISGRRHDFDNGDALLACLAHEQGQVGQPHIPSNPSRSFP